MKQPQIQLSWPLATEGKKPANTAYVVGWLSKYNKIFEEFLYLTAAKS